MMTRSLLVLSLGVVAVGAHAEAPASAVKSAPKLHLTGPEIVKLDWNTRCPRSADFNADGLPDIALINQDRARVEILLQGKAGVKLGQPEARGKNETWNPILELSRFEKQPLVVGSSMYSLAVGDWNDDGRTDLAYTTDDGKLVLRMHGKEMADWTQKKEFALDSVSDDSDSLLAADLNGDKRLDLIVLTETRLMIYLQAGKGEWQDPLVHAVTAKGSSALRAADLNGDGRIDLFRTAADAKSVLVRLQTATGGFGEEWAIEIAQGQSWVQPLRLAQGAGLTWLQEHTGLVEVARLAQAAAAENESLAASVRHAIPPTEAKTGASCYGDITGDGIGDVVIAEAKAARVWVFVGRKDATFEEGREYPSLSGAEVLVAADVDGDKSPELILLSPAEKTVAKAKWAGSRLTYPEIVYQSEDPLVGLAIGKYADGKSTAIVTVADKKSKPQLVSLRWSPAEKKYLGTQTELPAPPAKISGLSLLDADNDGLGDIALFSNSAPMQVLLSRADAKAPLKKVEGLPDSLTTKLSPAALSQSDLDGDGKLEIIIARDQFARVISVAADAKAKVIDQFNAPGNGAQLTGAITLGNKDPKQRRVLLVDSSQHKLHDMRLAPDGVFRPHSSKSLGSASLDDARWLGTEGAQKLLLLGRQGFEVFPLRGPTMSLQRLATFTTELKDTSPVDLLIGRFSNSSADDIVLMDTKQSRVAEFFQSESAEAKSWRSYLYFQIFQADPHYRGKAGLDAEPHDYAVLDITGDGKSDLCLLVHDRLLLYTQD